MNEIEKLAEELYENYCKEVGGKAFNGDPLPNWKDFSSDPNKQKQANAWVSVAKTAQSYFDRHIFGGTKSFMSSDAWPKLDTNTPEFLQMLENPTNSKTTTYCKERHQLPQWIDTLSKEHRDLTSPFIQPKE